MTLVTDSENQPSLREPAGVSHPGIPRIPTLGPIFLMVNSLETGGSERQFLELARSLRCDEQDVRLGFCLKRGKFPSDLGTFHHFGLGGSLYGLKSMQTRWRLSTYLRSLNVSVAHAFDFYTNLMMIPAARLAGVPVVIGSHRQLGDLLTPRQFSAQLRAFQMCHRVICNSRAAAQRLIQAGLPERRIAIVGNALPREAFAPTAPAMPRKLGVTRVGMIARMNAASKNHAGFLRAAAHVHSKSPNTEFVLVGDGPLRPELERQAVDLGLGESVHFLGDRSDIPAILASLDLSVVPSRSESLSNVMLESMAAGVPVIATSVGGNPELAADGRAFLVSPDDDESLVKALEHALAESTYASAMAEKARTFALANFTVDKVRSEYYAVYSEVLDRARGHKTARARRTEPARKLQVAVVAPSLRYVGGQSVQAELLLRNWKDDPEVQATLLPVDPDFPRGLRWAARVPVLRTIIREPLYLLSLWRNLRSAEIAHIFSASYSSFLLAPLPAWFIARARGVKTLINYHSGECKDHLQHSPIARRILRNSDTVVVPSGFLAAVLREFEIDARVVPNVVDLSEYRYRQRNRLRAHLVCTRGFHPYYGVDVVVKAFAEIQKRFPDAQLDLVGGGPSEQQIRELVRQMKMTGVNFVGVASRSQMPNFYDAADIFINGSNLDNMPVSILEAFASGTPVVSTAPEGIRYMVTHERTGLLSDIGDAGGLAGNILRILGDPTLGLHLAQNARDSLREYTWEVAREQWLGVYSCLVGKRANMQGVSSAIS